MAQRSSCGHQSPDKEELQPPLSLLRPSDRKKIRLSNPNVAQTAMDQSGRWTMIYDEAFEVNVDGLSFLAFSRFDLDYSGGTRTNVSRCSETQLGWYRNKAGTLWGCYYAKKKTLLRRDHPSLLAVAPGRLTQSPSYDEPLDGAYHSSFADTINSFQSLWTAKAHNRWVGMSLREMNGRAGIHRPFSMAEKREADPYFGQPDTGGIGPSFLQEASQTSRVTMLIDSVEAGNHEGGDADMPSQWNWGNVNGVTYLDPVLDQGECGSCYAVATTRMLSARHRIRLRNPMAEAFSINFPLHCAEYNQGCNGGYAFLISKWSQDVGLVPERCGHYNGSGSCQVQCRVDGSQRRWRADNHHYVGGYYGASTEQEMLKELMQGPLVASFEPKSDIMYYSGGIYKSGPNTRTEWEPVDHAVLLVGFGEDRGQKYWLLQNSWGEEWGEGGFFRMARGQDESGIESIVVSADVVEDSRKPQVLLEFVQNL